MLAHRSADPKNSYAVGVQAWLPKREGGGSVWFCKTLSSWPGTPLQCGSVLTQLKIMFSFSWPLWRGFLGWLAISLFIFPLNIPSPSPVSLTPRKGAARAQEVWGTPPGEAAGGHCSTRLVSLLPSHWKLSSGQVVTVTSCVSLGKLFDL